MFKLIAVLYGVACYLVFFLTFLYAVGFVSDLFVPKAIDSAPIIDWRIALVIDLALLGLFAIQHSLMARPAFKKQWTRLVPAEIERSTYVLFSSLALIVLFVFWAPIEGKVWSFEGDAAVALMALSGLGWLIVLSSTFLINHFDLFGLRQVWAYRAGKAVPPPDFKTPLFYRVVRHPLYVGFIIAFWATPSMSRGHLLFAVATTAYILIAIQLEEHDLIGTFGDVYRNYKSRVSMIVPWIPKKS
jgi:protein-S-isoprenylcysteine O-methyltransferase Ste14